MEFFNSDNKYISIVPELIQKRSLIENDPNVNVSINIDNPNNDEGDISLDVVTTPENEIEVVNNTEDTLDLEVESDEDGLTISGENDTEKSSMEHINISMGNNNLVSYGYGYTKEVVTSFESLSSNRDSKMAGYEPKVNAATQCIIKQFIPNKYQIYIMNYAEFYDKEFITKITHFLDTREKNDSIDIYLGSGLGEYIFELSPILNSMQKCNATITTYAYGWRVS